MPMAPMTVGRLFAWHPQPVPILPLLGLTLLVAYLLVLGTRFLQWQRTDARHTRTADRKARRE